jgi:hypothetical protein
MSKQSRIEWPGQGGGYGECAQVHRYIMSDQSVEESSPALPGAASGLVQQHQVHVFQPEVRARPLVP